MAVSHGAKKTYRRSGGFGRLPDSAGKVRQGGCQIKSFLHRFSGHASGEDMDGIGDHKTMTGAFALLPHTAIIIRPAGNTCEDKDVQRKQAKKPLHGREGSKFFGKPDRTPGVS